MPRRKGVMLRSQSQAREMTSGFYWLPIGQYARERRFFEFSAIKMSTKIQEPKK